MTADLGHAPVRRESPPTARPTRADIAQPIALVARWAPTARECGLSEGQDATGGTRCRDITPELMIELI